MNRSLSLYFFSVASALAVLGACVGEDVPNSPSAPANGGQEGGASIDDGGTANVCEAPKSTCGDACVDLHSDPSHCGTCATSCGEAGCFEGVCDGARAVKIASGYTFACALRKSGSVWCWGGNGNAQLGGRNLPGEKVCDGKPCSPTPVRIPGVEHAVAIEAGYDAACAVTETGEAYCWGRNAGKELGDVPVENCVEPCVAKPTRFPLEDSIAEIGLGFRSACARTTAGDVYCVGDNNLGQRGNGVFDGTATVAPSKVIGLGAAQTLTMGAGPATHACAIVAGSAWCWGANQSAQIKPIAAGTTCPLNQPCIPTPTSLVGVSAQVYQVAAGDGATCVRDPVGKVVCRGTTSYGVVAGASPFEVATVGPAVEITAKGETLCSRLSNGQVKCVGASAGGRLGAIDPNVAQSDWGCSLGPCIKTGTLVPDLEAIAISVFTPGLAIRADGAVMAWGTAELGLLGHEPGTNGDATCPNAGSPPTVPCNPNPQVVTLPASTPR